MCPPNVEPFFEKGLRDEELIYKVLRAYLAEGPGDGSGCWEDEDLAAMSIQHSIDYLLDEYRRLQKEQEEEKKKEQQDSAAKNKPKAKKRKSTSV